MSKGLLVRLAEDIEQWRVERRERQATQAQPVAMNGRWRGWLPTKGNVLFVALVVTALAWANNAGALTLRAPDAPAAVTSTIAYQGRIADAGGSPLTGTYSMVFRLYEVVSGGSPVWTEQWTGSNGVRVSDGLFNVMLGSLTSIPQSAVVGKANLWLGISVGTDDEMTPRVQLGSVPFAVQALTVPDGSITTAKIADVAVTSAKQTLATYQASDNSYVRLDGSTPAMTVSEFAFDNVPAGDVDITVSLVGFAEINATANGAVWLEVAGSELAGSVRPTHVLSTLYTSMVLHGILHGFTGGTLRIRVMSGTEDPSSKIAFGSPNSDSRFGRHITVIAGL